jgi:hypothetical protein
MACARVFIREAPSNWSLSRKEDQGPSRNSSPWFSPPLSAQGLCLCCLVALIADKQVPYLTYLARTRNCCSYRFYKWTPLQRRATTDGPQTALDHTASAAHRQRIGSASAAERQPGCSKLHCTKPIVDSDLSKATHGSRRSSMTLRADTWRCSRLGVQSRKHG